MNDVSLAQRQLHVPLAQPSQRDKMQSAHSDECLLRNKNGKRQTWTRFEDIPSGIHTTDVEKLCSFDCKEPFRLAVDAIKAHLVDGLLASQVFWKPLRGENLMIVLVSESEDVQSRCVKWWKKNLCFSKEPLMVGSRNAVKRAFLETSDESTREELEQFNCETVERDKNVQVVVRRNHDNNTHDLAHKLDSFAYELTVACYAAQRNVGPSVLCAFVDDYAKNSKFTMILESWQTNALEVLCRLTDAQSHDLFFDCLVKTVFRSCLRRVWNMDFRLENVLCNTDSGLKMCTTDFECSMVAGDHMMKSDLVHAMPIIMLVSLLAERKFSCPEQWLVCRKGIWRSLVKFEFVKEDYEYVDLARIVNDSTFEYAEVHFRKGVDKRVAEEYEVFLRNVYSMLEAYVWTLKDIPQGVVDTAKYRIKKHGVVDMTCVMYALQ